MNLERYAKALAEEVDRSVEALLTESRSQDGFDLQSGAEPRQAVADEMRTETIVRDHHAQVHRYEQQSALFPGARVRYNRFGDEIDDNRFATGTDNY